MGEHGEDIRPPGHVPLWVAAWLVQAGSFVMALGVGAILASFLYSFRSLLLGLAMVSLGYVSMNLPWWYVNRMPRLREEVSHGLRRLYQAVSRKGSSPDE